MDKVREQAIKNSEPWWYCDNIVNHRKEVGLLRMDFPRVFILIRDPQDAYFASFEEFRDHIAEVNFMTPSERAEADVEQILIDAWNFMALQEELEEEEVERINEEEDW